MCCVHVRGVNECVVCVSMFVSLVACVWCVCVSFVLECVRAVCMCV